MKINEKRAFNILKKISYIRVGGSGEELECANTILEEIKELDNEAYLQDFEIERPDVKKVSFEVLEPVYKEYNVTAYGLSGSTPDKGIEAEFKYVQDCLEADLQDVRGKIVLVNEMLRDKNYEALLKAKVAGIICPAGSVYDKIETSDLTIRQMRPRLYEKGLIPSVSMRINDAKKLVLSSPTKVRLILTEEKIMKTSHNVIGNIIGTKYPDEVICITAHYDSVYFSKGAYDNGTGAVTIIELMHYFKKNPPLRTLRFIWCGSEEMGLLGSTHYITSLSKEEKEKILFCINYDMTGVVMGKDIAVCTSDMSLVNYIDYFSKQVGFPIQVRQGVYSSDSTPFADNGVPAISFARISSTGGAEIHSRKDIIDNVKAKFLNETILFGISFIEQMASANTFPIPKHIPGEMCDKLDDYYGR